MVVAQLHEVAEVQEVLLAPSRGEVVGRHDHRRLLPGRALVQEVHDRLLRGSALRLALAHLLREARDGRDHHDHEADHCERPEQPGRRGGPPHGARRSPEDGRSAHRDVPGAALHTPPEGDFLWR